MLDRSIYDDATEIDPNWFFEMRDPRMKASIFYPGSSFKGGTVHFHRSMSGSLSGWPRTGPSKHIGSRTTYYKNVKVLKLSKTKEPTQLQGLPLNPKLSNFNISLLELTTCSFNSTIDESILRE